MELKSDIHYTFGESLHTKMQLCIWDDLSSQLDELKNKINSSEKVINPFPLLALIDNPELQMKTAEILVNEKYPQSHVLSKIERYQKHKKIRIGYFSADFRNHPVSTLKTELYELHDRSQFEIYAFSYGPDTKDEMNLRIKAGVDYFHDVHKMLDKDLAILSRSFEIDIAVDLGGFTQDSRTGVFALQAAPIQVNYLGYPGTMAANYMDYLIADRTLIPEEKKYHYLEKIVYMPNSFMVNDTKTKLSNRLFTRVETGLPTNGFVFCCFNNYYKITPNIFIGWMQILKAVEDSVLWLSEGNSTAIKNLKKEAKKNGVDENRLIFAPRLDSMKDHLNRIQLADLFIDTLPYNAHATSSDALRMGLPVLTCVGNSFASRVAASLLNAVNLPELITTTQEQYESLAIQLATNPEKLKIIKDKLVNNLPTAPLYDTPLFTRQLESAYLTMYDRYQQGLDPDYIYVEH
jgi:predicted O-linked N-acetylglucosamine transferase (SPINDLY family)